MPKQAKTETPLDKAAQAYADALDKVMRLRGERAEAVNLAENLAGDLQTAEMDLSAAGAALTKAAVERS